MGPSGPVAQGEEAGTVEASTDLLRNLLELQLRILVEQDGGEIADWRVDE